MSCGGCNNHLNNNNGITIISTGTPVDYNGTSAWQNFRKAIVTQNSLYHWFIGGAAGIIKCAIGNTIYDDEAIIKNREFCRDCEYRSDKDVHLDIEMKSQCMAPTPSGEICACFLMCLTQQKPCPIGKFTPISISVN